MFSSHVAEVLLDLVTERIVYAGQQYAFNYVALPIHQSDYAPSNTAPRLKHYDKEINIIQNFSATDTSIESVFACGQFGCNKTTKNRFVMIARNVENTLVQRVAKVLLLLF